MLGYVGLNDLSSRQTDQKPIFSELNQLAQPQVFRTFTSLSLTNLY